MVGNDDIVMRAAKSNVSGNLPTMPLSQLAGHDGPVRVVKFSRCGTYCISGDNSVVRLWNPIRADPAYTNEYNSNATTSYCGEKAMKNIGRALPIQIYSDGHTHGIDAIDSDDSSTTLLSSSGKNLIVTDVISRKLKHRIQGHYGRINAVACSSNGSVFLSGSYDGSVRLYDGKSYTSKPIQILNEATDSISSIDLLQGEFESEIVTTSVDGCMRTYDLRKGLLKVDNFGGNMALTCVSHTSDHSCSVITCLNGAIHVIERSSGLKLNTCYGGHTSGHYSLQCDVTADDQHIACGSEDGRAVFYNFESGHIVQTLHGHHMATCSVACNPDQTKCSVTVTGSYDGNAIVWSNINTQLI